MITITRVKQAVSQFIKVLRYGTVDVQTAQPVLPYGIDSKPIKGSLGVHSETSDRSASVLLGYILNSEKTLEGETRIYATNAAGTEVFDIFLKRDGTCEFGGNVDFFVRYNALDVGLQTFVTALNLQLTTAFALVPYTWVNVPLNIDASKISNIKSS